MRPCFWLLPLCLLLLHSAGLAQEKTVREGPVDVVWLKGGGYQVGHVQKETAEYTTLETEVGQLRIKNAKIARVEHGARDPAAGPEAPPGALYRGRLFDRYPWVRVFGPVGALVLFALLFCATTLVLSGAVRFLDIRNVGFEKVAAVALLWNLFLVAILAVPSPTLVTAVGAGAAILAGWLATMIFMLRTSGSQTVMLGILSLFSISMLTLIGEIAR